MIQDQENPQQEQDKEQSKFPSGRNEQPGAAKQEAAAESLAQSGQSVTGIPVPRTEEQPGETQQPSRESRPESAADTTQDPKNPAASRKDKPHHPSGKGAWGNSSSGKHGTGSESIPKAIKDLHRDEAGLDG